MANPTAVFAIHERDKRLVVRVGRPVVIVKTRETPDKEVTDLVLKRSVLKQSHRPVCETVGRESIQCGRPDLVRVSRSSEG